VLETMLAVGDDGEMAMARGNACRVWKQVLEMLNSDVSRGANSVCGDEEVG